jgi:4-aminobutyrate aminotransferase/(S)-3-amino-2-methylpropionate transaminase
MAGAPMGPRGVGAGIVLSRGAGANLFDADDNRYVDLAGGFGSLLLGHGHPEVTRAIERQGQKLTQALGDLYSSEEKIALLERLRALFPGEARAIVAQSGSDAVTAALKTALLHTGRPGIISFAGAYHGLGYGPLAALGLRPSYREPFAAQLNPHVVGFDYPSDEIELAAVLDGVQRTLAHGNVGAILVEPILGRGGVVVPPAGFLSGLAELGRARGALLIADEIWTGLGRAGKRLFSQDLAQPDLICLGKGLGGGVPLSAVVGRAEVMQSWSREAEVVHTSTFAGAPLACAAALALLDVLERGDLVERARDLGERFREALEHSICGRYAFTAVRGRGLMIGIDLGGHPGAGARLQRALLERGYVTSSGGGQREVLVLTPPLNIAEPLLFGFVPELARALEQLS